MPVPVPYTPNPCSHPVVKLSSCISAQVLVQKTMPAPTFESSPPLGPCEEWANSPPWPRIHHCSSWDHTSCHFSQDFSQGLTASGNAAVIKGAHAEACILPACNPHPKVAPSEQSNDSEMSSTADEADAEMRRNIEYEMKGKNYSLNYAPPPNLHVDTTVSIFTPVLEDQSPDCASGPDSGSSPLEPLTPFADFIDRAVTAAQTFAQQDDSKFITAEDRHVPQEVTHAALVFPTIADLPRHQDQSTTATPPSANSGHKKLVEPLAEWLANYVWKACSTGYRPFSQPAYVQVFRCLKIDAKAPFKRRSISHFAIETPAYLAPRIQSILLATLLQPSAVFLALWYIVRLPVYLEAPGGENAKVTAFRSAFLDGSRSLFDHEATENTPLLRLVVLGFMLANKWLDDHTFSNKTWCVAFNLIYSLITYYFYRHSISNIPIQTLNTLESCALDIFAYDLSISNEQWSQWLAHVMAHHMSLTSPDRLQPISRPSSNPHTVVRRAIEEVMRASVILNLAEGTPQPVFLGLEKRLREKMENEAAMIMDVLEIDLDEDGPLKEEYLPKRRANKLALQDSRLQAVDPKCLALLPPPAKWSPAGDEPIHRDRSRSNSYLPVQAPHPAPVYPILGRPAFNHHWAAAPFIPAKELGYEFPTFFSQVQPTYNQFGQNTSIPLPHLRSQSLTYDQDNLLSRIHLRSYSQAGFGYGFNDFRLSMSDHSISVPEMDARWMNTTFPYTGPVFVPIPTAGHQPAW